MEKTLRFALVIAIAALGVLAGRLTAAESQIEEGQPPSEIRYLSHGDGRVGPGVH